MFNTNKPNIIRDYWMNPQKDTGNACRTDYIKLVERRQQKSREVTRGLYRAQHLTNTEIN